MNKKGIGIKIVGKEDSTERQFKNPGEFRQFMIKHQNLLPPSERITTEEADELLDDREYSVLVVLVPSEEADTLRASVDSATDLQENVPLNVARQIYDTAISRYELFVEQSMSEA